MILEIKYMGHFPSSTVVIEMWVMLLWMITLLHEQWKGPKDYRYV